MEESIVKSIFAADIAILAICLTLASTIETIRLLLDKESQWLLFLALSIGCGYIAVLFFPGIITCINALIEFI